MNQRTLQGTLAATVMISLVVFGCGPNKRRGPGGPLPNPPKMPPPPPAKKDVPIDPNLRSDATKELATAFASSDGFIRANAVEATQKGLGLAGADRYLKGLTDDKAVVRFASAMAIGTLKIKSAYPKLQTLLNDESKAVCVATRYALHRLGDTRFSHDLEVFATDSSPRVRANTALVLGLLGEPSATKILRPMMSDLDASTRLQVMESLYRLGDEQAREKLVVGTVSNDPGDQILSLLALAAPRDERVFKVLAGKLTSDYDEVTLAAARALGMIGRDEGMTVALKKVDAKDPRQRSMAALALGEIGRSDAQPALSKLLKDADPSVRLSAATAILQLK